MGESARITSVDAVVHFLNVLRTQQDRATELLTVQQQEMNRVSRWFEEELPYQWRQVLRRRYDKVAETRTAYENCRLRTVAGERPACFEEKKAYERAKQSLRDVEAKEEVVQRWRTRYMQEAQECQGRLSKLQNYLDHDLERTIALLERMVDSLEEYLGRLVSDDEGESPSEKG